VGDKLTYAEREAIRVKAMLRVAGKPGVYIINHYKGVKIDRPEIIIKLDTSV
jgi:hypothetical protein